MSTPNTGPWDAPAYHEISTPMVALGQLVLDRLELSGTETVLDAGCGTGRLTADLHDRLTQGRVVGIDPSEEMLAVAREFLGPLLGPRVALVRGDAGRLPFRNAFDVIFSTATLHWILDHDRLFESLFAALKAGGRLEAQCGGTANIGRVLGRAAELMREPPFAPHFAGWTDGWYFADTETTRHRMVRAGFSDIDTSVQHVPVILADAPAFKRYISTIIVRPHLQRLSPELGDTFLDALATQSATDDPPFTLDYCRLNLSGRKG